MVLLHILLSSESDTTCTCFLCELLRLVLGGNSTAATITTTIITNAAITTTATIPTSTITTAPNQWPF